MIPALAVVISLLVVLGTGQGIVTWFDHLDRAAADPVGRARLTRQERWLVADLERRLRRADALRARRGRLRASDRD